MPTLYRWKVIDDHSPWRMTGKVLGWHMTEEQAQQHEAIYERALEKVPGSDFVPQPLGGTSDFRK